MIAAVVYLALCWSGHDAGRHELITQHLLNAN
jgi:hypothetical protein